MGRLEAAVESFNRDELMRGCRSVWRLWGSIPLQLSAKFSRKSVRHLTMEEQWPGKLRW